MKKKNIFSKSFGKIILAGEHAVVYGKPAIILPIDRFCEVTISKTVKQSDSETVNKKIIVINTEKDNHGIVTHVINSFFKEFKISPPAGGLQIEIKSNIPVGRGFGSSAAVITALVKGLSKYFSVGLDHGQPLQLLNFCISCENLIHKKSSGADIYAAWFGKPIYFQNQNGKIKYQAINCNYRDKSRLVPTNYVLIDTGKPVESTGEMVHLVQTCPRGSGDRNSNPFGKLRTRLEIRNKLENIINEISKQTKILYKIFSTTPPQLFTDVSIHHVIDKIENCLENLGVVSKDVVAFIRELNRQKISAKICGAGGFKKGSGIVIALTSDEGAVKTRCSQYKYSILDVKIIT